jgi:hypothetical protein
MSVSGRSLLTTPVAVTYRCTLRGRGQYQHAEALVAQPEQELQSSSFIGN